MQLRLRLWMRDDRGATSIEYAVLAALISCGILVSVRSVGANLSGVYAAIADGLSGGGAVAVPPATTNGVHAGGM